jgi:hypothetical protein
MNNRIIIGLEAHDATGKSGTAIELLKIFDGEVSKVSKEMKIKRREICEPISVLKSFTEKKDYSETEYNQQMFDNACKAMDDTYLEESVKVGAIDSNFVVMDRTWASHAAERYYQSQIHNHLNPYLDNFEGCLVWPEAIVKPNIIFQIILVPDSARIARMIQRSLAEGIPINQREEKLEIARRKLGCKRFVIREKRDPIVCSLRISQIVLGSRDCPPMTVSLEHL